MSSKKDQIGNNGFLLMSKIGKTTTNMHRAFHVRKEFVLKVENVVSVESEDDEPPGIGISEIKAAMSFVSPVASTTGLTTKVKLE